MNILGKVYLVDEPHIDVLKQACMHYPPPGGRLGAGTLMCIDMDETDNMLEVWFPDHAQKATLLCPPPIAMYKEIDGDEEGFIECYNYYLDTDESVQDFIASMLMFLHIGGNIMMYTPSHLEDDAIWVNTLLLYFFTRFGITIGTSIQNDFQYDIKYDPEVATFIYSRGYMDVFDYINSSALITPDERVYFRLMVDLSIYCAPDENPMDLYNIMIYNLLTYRIPIIKPAVIFDR